MVVFSHIPKTAGTTLNAILRKNFGSKIVSVIPETGTTYSKSDFESDFGQNSPSAISGHCLKPFVNYGEHENRFQWITFLRDPIERYISQYVHEKLFDRKPIKDVVSWGEKFQRCNWQVKWLAGEENLEKAKEVVHKKLVFVGVVEHFDESLHLMNQRLNTSLDISYRAPKMVVLDNTLKQRLLADGKVRGFAASQNQLDVRLYNYVLDNTFYNQGVAGHQDPSPESLSYLTEKNRMCAFYFRNYFYRKRKKKRVDV